MITKVFGWIAALLFVSSVVCTPVYASVNDFVIKSFDVDYYLSADNKGRSELRTIETIIAQFPDYDQNHGIERALVTTYDGHSTNLLVQSVIDNNGASIEYSTSWQGDNLILRIGDPDIYVHGLKTYIINYQQHDVTRYFVDTDSDEFYWDVNGTNWYQSFDQVSARLHLDNNVANNTTGRMSCYYGVSGASNSCQISQDSDVIKTTVNSLIPGENVTIAVGFKSGTFAAYKMTFSGFIDKYMAIISALIGLLGLLAVFVLKLIRGRDYDTKKAVIPEYLPPQSSDIVLSSIIRKRNQSWIAAIFVDLAVRHKIRIIEQDKKKYLLEFIKSDGLNDNEIEVVKILFGESPKPGDNYLVDKNRTNTKMAYKFSALYRKVRRWAVKNDYYLNKRNLKMQMMVVLALSILQMIGVIVFSRPGVTVAVGVLAVALGLTIVTGITILTTTKPLSKKGRELLDYLKGLEIYIKTAEKDRLKMLQSPEGADRKPVNIDDKRLMIRLYERVLPYAVLFGIEKEWVSVLGKYYDEQAASPDWYSGTDVFNAALFSSAISSFSSSVKNNSYLSSSSSSSGGSGGGGFSGGGGGGGGGGGW